MKRRLFCLVMTLMMVFIMMPAAILPAHAATEPSVLFVASSTASGIPDGEKINVCKPNTGNVYQLFLPGNADVDNCRFSWEGSVTVKIGGTTYDKGTCPVPEVNTQTTYNIDGQDYYLITYKGSPDIHKIFIDIDESQGTIAEMNGDDDHEATCVGEIFIDGTKYTMPEIKGRGNYTWKMRKDKCAYNFKVDGKINFPGVDSAKTKKWTLLAESADHSLLCNRSGFYLAEKMGIGQPTTSADVWMNGIYRGCYTVTPKYDSFVTDDGFMIENDNYKETQTVAEGGDPQFALDGMHGSNNSTGSNNKDNLITVKEIGDNLLMNSDGVVDKSPENVEAVAADIQSWLQEAWDAIRANDGKNPTTGKKYTDYIDIESFAKMYLMHEYVKSYDVCAGSILFHRDGTSDSDKLIAGPLWDLDNAMGSTQTNGSLGSVGDRKSGKGDFIINITEYKTSIYKTLYTKHEDFREEVARQYCKYRPAFNSLYDDVGTMAGAIEASAMMNHRKVIDVTNYNLHKYNSNVTLESGTEYSQSMLATTSTTTDWPNYVANLRTYINARSKWLNNSTAYKVDNYITVTGISLDKTEQAAKCGDIINLAATVTPNNATDPDVVWESSDPKVASVDSNGVVTVLKNGEAKITARSGAFSAYCMINCNSHDMEAVAAKAATCTKDGNIAHWKCKVCKKLFFDEEGQNEAKKKDITIIALGHNMEEHAAAAATCTEAGNNLYWSCDRCNKRFQDPDGTAEITDDSWMIPSLGHDPVHHDAKAATCTEIGWKAYDTCSRCDYTTYEEIPALGHDMTAHAAVAAKCEAAGNSAYWSCSRCNKHFSDEDGTTEVDEGSWVVPATGHKYGDLVAKVDASCTDAGMEAHYECSACHKYFDADKKETTADALTIGALGHDMTAHAAVPATCEETGSSAYWSCSRCGKFFSDEEGTTAVDEGSWVIPAAGHKYGDLVAKVDASCTETGMEAHYECSDCHKYFDADKKETTKDALTIGALGHDMTAHAAVAATCEEAGNSAYWSCSRCGKYFSDEEGTTAVDEGSWVIPAAGHKYGDLVAKVDASCTETGMEAHYECSDCHKYFDADKKETTSDALTISALGHDMTAHAAVPATCEEAGSSAYWSCSRCGKFFSDEGGTTEVEEGSWVVPATGHKYGDLIAKVDASCTEAGMEAHYQCSACHKYFDADKKETTSGALTISALGHDMTAHAAVPATCEEAGSSAYWSCSRCDKFFSDKDGKTEIEEGGWVVPATGHKYGDLVAKVDASCTEAGMEAHYECSACHKYFDKDKKETTSDALTISALGHDMTAHAAVEARCEEAGSSAYWSCSRCDKFFSDKDGKTEIEEGGWVVPATGHKYGDLVAKVDASCTEAGMEAHYECSACHKYFDKDKKETTSDALTIGALGHEYGNLIAKVDASCAETGMEAHYECSACHKYFDADKKETTSDALTISALGHDMTAHAAVPETCEEAGSSAYWSCSRCGKYFSDEDGKAEIEEGGWTVPAAGHKYGDLVAKAVASCTEAGMEAHYECSACHKYFDANKTETTSDALTIGALGHDWGEWSVVTGATEDEEGLEQRVCNRGCGESQERVIEKLSHVHVPVKVEAVEPTCEKDGNIEYWTCEKCGKFFADANAEIEITEEDILDKTSGHDWTDGRITKEPEVGKEGEITYTCSKCGQTYPDPIPALSPEQAEIYGAVDAAAEAANQAQQEAESIDENASEKALADTDKLVSDIVEEAIAAVEAAEAAAREAEEDPETAIYANFKLDQAEKTYAKAMISAATVKTAAAKAAARKAETAQSSAAAAAVKPGEEAVKAAEAAEAAAKESLQKATIAKETADAALKAAIGAGYSEDDKEYKAAVDAVTEAETAKIKAETKLAEATAAVKAAKEKTMEIVDLPKVKISKATAGKKTAAVKWKKVSKKSRKKISKIQIQYSTDKNFTKNVKTTTAKKSAVSKKIKKLKAGKKYYFKVRAYKKINGVVHVSKWSKVRYAKVK